MTATMHVMENQKPSFWRWLGLFGLSLLMAMLWSYLLMAIWIEIGEWISDDPVRDFGRLFSKANGAFVLAIFLSEYASAFGAITGCLVLGFRPGRTRWPVLASSGTGALVSAVIGFLFGLSLGGFFSLERMLHDAERMWKTDSPAVFVLLLVALSLPIGIAGGWIGGLMMRRPAK